MLPLQLEWEEITGHLHPLSPRPSESALIRITYDFDPSRQSITSIEITLIPSPSGSPTTLRFHNAWSNANPGELCIPDPLGSGILIVDVAHRGWEKPILVVSDDEETRTLFGAARVERVA
jgi:hypothetical protein